MLKIGFINIKGGVGKTILAFNFAHALAKRGKVLVVDMDPQGNMSMGFNLRNPTYQVGDALVTAEFLDGCMEVNDRIDILPCGTRTQGKIRTLTGEPDENFRLKRVLKVVEQKYDYCIMDCRPALDPLTINALIALDYILIPTFAEPCSLAGIESVVMTVEQIKNSELNPGLEIGGIILNRYYPRKILSKKMVKELHKNYGDLLLETYVREDVKFTEGHAQCLPVFKYAPKSRGAEDLMKLINEIGGKIHVKRAAA